MNNIKRIPVLCGESKCTACSACLNICPKDAIQMKETNKGELHPIINEDKCIKCGLCEEICPENEKKYIERNGSPDVFYCWLNDAEIRKNSTSGGAAYAISRAIIEEKGHVWGAAYDEDLNVLYVEANTLEELKRIQKSKYVQSAVGFCFKKIKEELDSGDIVLFAGTGCHVKGLRSYLRKEYPNLYTLDLVCHGVPGGGVFRRYKQWLEERYGDKLVDFQFRPKREDGQEECYYTLASFKNKGEKKIEGNENGYFIGFQSNLFLRNACYDCQSNGEKRFSDFTVADFWGLGKKEPFVKNLERSRGISMLALNTEKAKLLFDLVKKEFVYGQRSYAEASYSNTQYYKSAVPSKDKNKFWIDWNNNDWDYLTKYMCFSRKGMLLYYVKKLTPPIVYLMLNYWRNNGK